MRAIVIGGAGFIGSHLCRRLLDDDWDVTCLTPATSKIDRVASLVGPQFRICDYDVTGWMPLTAQVIFNVSGQGSPKHYREDPIGTLKTNVLGTLNVMQAAEQYGSTVVYASTIRTYEADQHLGPNGGYIEGKRCAETIISSYNRTRGTHGRIVRMGNVYGPGMAIDDSKVLPTFVRRALAGEELRIIGGGRQRDTFCYVTDAVDALVRVATSESDDPIDIGGREPISILELARLVVKVTGSTSLVTHDEDDHSPVRDWIPDYSEASEALGWEPEVGLVKGIATTAEHYSALMDER